MPFIVVIVLLFCAILIILAVRAMKSNSALKKSFLDLQKSDNRFSNSKLFGFINTSFILVSESGFIALKSYVMKDIKILNIKDITGFEVITDGKPVANIGGAVAGGLLFGGVGAIIGAMPQKEKITKMSFVFKTNDFNNPSIDIPVIMFGSVKKGSFEHQAIEQQLKDLSNTLEVVEKKRRE